MDGFDTKELEKYERDLLSLAQEQLPKECNKFLKKSAGKLSTVNKNAFKSCGAATGSGATEQEMLRRFKAGKVYKYNGAISCRAYASHPLAHLLDLGFVHKGGFKVKNGVEKWVPGYHFMDKAEKSYEEPFYSQVEAFIDDTLTKGLK